MDKTKYWLSILAISVVLIAGSLAMSPIAIADDDDDDDDDDESKAKPSKVGFGFVADDFSGPGPAHDIVMTGGGVWTSGTMKIKASGSC